VTISVVNHNDTEIALIQSSESQAVKN